jgi:hypothetical protein
VKHQQSAVKHQQSAVKQQGKAPLPRLQTHQLLTEQSMINVSRYIPIDEGGLLES